MNNRRFVKEISTRDTRSNRLKVRIAESEHEIRDCLALRYEIFANEMGANLASTEIDRDRFDAACTHLMVYELESGEVVATTRLLSSDEAPSVGGFYSQTEFDLDRVLARPGRFVEVGRTCIHPAYRTGAALALLWHGIAREVAEKKVDYLMGCASIDLASGDRYLASVMRQLRKRHFSGEDCRVQPRIPVRLDECETDNNVILPTLLKAYLKQGAVICGEPYWDAEFGVADVFVLLDCERIASRYQRHFVDRISA